jgi:hypothetical protein
MRSIPREACTGNGGKTSGGDKNAERRGFQPPPFVANTGFGEIPEGNQDDNFSTLAQERLTPLVY